MTVAAAQRFKKGRPCPICGGTDGDPRGKGRRCHGFLSDDGTYAHCARDEHAHGLPAEKGGTYAHKIGGPCRCGVTHSDEPRDWDGIDAAYDYRDEHGALLFQVVRKYPKRFVQRRPKPGGGWDWQTSGVQRVLYRLMDVLKAPPTATIYIVEGEKDVESLRGLGLIATCNPMGAGKWHFIEEGARPALAGRHVVIIPDNDETGHKHAAQVEQSLTGYASSIRKLVLPGPGKDASDWIAAGGTRAQLEQLVGTVEAVEVEQQPEDRIPLITNGQALEQLVKLSQAPVYTTPFPALNEALGFGGMLGGQVYDVCSGTGRGKTSLAGQFALHHARHGEVLCAFYEAFAGYNVARMAAGLLGLPSNEIIRNVGQHGAAILRAMPPRFQQLDRPSLATVRAATLKLADRSGRAPLVIIDYMQKLGDMIQAGQHRPDPRLAMSQASAEVLDLASSTGATVIAINAISRQSNRRSQDPRKLAPYELVDVAKESGAVEYDSAGMLVVSLANDWEGDERIATLTVAKARFGLEQHIDMRFHGARGSWRDLGRVDGDEGEDIEDAIRKVLARGPAESRTALATATKKRRGAVLKAIKSMLDEGELVETARGFELA